MFFYLIFKAIVITIDRPISSIRYSTMRYKFKFPTPANFPNVTKELQEILTNPAHSWDELRWLRNQTSMKIVVKGVLRPEDARNAVRCGADAIIVSNHGGRYVNN